MRGMPSINFLLIIALACGFTQLANAVGVQGTIGNDTYTDYEEHVISDTQNNIVTQGTIETGNWDVIGALPINTSVGSSINFGAQSDAFLMDTENSALVVTKFIKK